MSWPIMHPPEVCAFCRWELQRREADIRVTRPWNVLFADGPLAGQTEAFELLGKQIEVLTGRVLIDVDPKRGKASPGTDLVYDYVLVDEPKRFVIAMVRGGNTPRPHFVPAP